MSKMQLVGPDCLPYKVLLGATGRQRHVDESSCGSGRFPLFPLEFKHLFIIHSVLWARSATMYHELLIPVPNGYKL